jgi:hypothetical protein
MSSHREKSDEDPASAPEVTALVPHTQSDPERWGERQQAILEQLHRGLQAVGPSYPELNGVWLQLRGEWSWVVMMPAEPDWSTGELAQALSQAGARLSVYPVEFIEATDLDLDSSSRLIARLGISATAESRFSSPDGQPVAPNSHAPPITKTVVALESPLANPLTLPIALAADGVVLCVRRGRDRIASVRRTIQAIGADRILCCLLLD